MAEHGTYHLADNPTIYQPVRQNNFRCEIDFSSNEYIFNNGLYKAGHPGEANYRIDLKPATEVIDFSVISFTAPHFSQDPIAVKRGNSTVYYAGVPTFNQGQLEINDFVGADGKSTLIAWQALSYDVESDTIASSDHYKVDATVFEYLPDNTLVRYWVLKGCWIQDLKESDWNAEQGNKKNVTATIRYDRAIPHYSYGEIG